MVIVMTVDQRGSRLQNDLVPATLSALSGMGSLHDFERTAGDELQGVLDDPAALPRIVEVLLRSRSWSVGIGIGPAQLDASGSARAGRGPAFVFARDAVSGAKRSPWHVCVLGDGEGVRHLESALWLWASILGRRSERGWEVVDLVDAGNTYDEAADRLGISQSAVSQRAQAAGLVEGRRARELVEYLAAALLADDP